MCVAKTFLSSLLPCWTRPRQQFHPRQILRRLLLPAMVPHSPLRHHLLCCSVATSLSAAVRRLSSYHHLLFVCFMFHLLCFIQLIKSFPIFSLSLSTHKSLNLTISSSITTTSHHNHSFSLPALSLQSLASKYHHHIGLSAQKEALLGHDLIMEFNGE